MIETTPLSKIIATAPAQLTVLASYPHGSPRGTAQSVTYANKTHRIEPVSVEDLQAALEARGYKLVSADWSGAADRKVRFSHDTVLPRTRTFVFQRSGAAVPPTVAASAVIVGDVVVGYGEVTGTRRSAMGGLTLYFKHVYLALRRDELVELVRPDVRDGAPLGAVDVVPPTELCIGDMYHDRKKRITYLGDDLGEWEGRDGRIERDQVFAFTAYWLLVYRPTAPDAAALARSTRAALRAVGVDDMDADERRLEVARVWG